MERKLIWDYGTEVDMGYGTEVDMGYGTEVDMGLWNGS
jgi:hypothetical protein